MQPDGFSAEWDESQGASVYRVSFKREDDGPAGSFVEYDTIDECRVDVGGLEECVPYEGCAGETM